MRIKRYRLQGCLKFVLGGKHASTCVDPLGVNLYACPSDHFYWVPDQLSKGLQDEDQTLYDEL